MISYNNYKKERKIHFSCRLFIHFYFLDEKKNNIHHESLSNTIQLSNNFEVVADASFEWLFLFIAIDNGNCSFTEQTFFFPI